VKKRRIDIALVERGFFESREKAQRALMAGEVFVGTTRINKGAHLLSPDEEAKIALAAKDHAVSRAYYKLKNAFDVFGLSAQNRIAIDIGASTGGFTQYLLEQGAHTVYAVDCGTNQLAYVLRQDVRVIVMEKTNARYITRKDIEKAFARKVHSFGEAQRAADVFATAADSSWGCARTDTTPGTVVSLEAGAPPAATPGVCMPDLSVMDVSFISSTLILPQIIREFPLHEIALLIKPQFEAGRSDVPKGGIVRDASVHRDVLRRIAAFARELNFPVCALTHSPLKGSDGNIEFLALLRRNGEVLSSRIRDSELYMPGDEAGSSARIDRAVAEAHGSL
jgi:23S rRNA (cytidine1920-2'-O)/16S rRNA (cytidine1409-2'-O)-methyltransferase